MFGAVSRAGNTRLETVPWPGEHRPMKLPAHHRYAHSAIPSRPVYDWPGGKRLALLVVNNIEHFAYRAGLGSDSTSPAPIQNQRSYAWRDYGNRVGLWNMLDMLDELGIPSAHNINSAALDACPEIGPALLAIFPFTIMFLVTSVTTLRERSSGTLERLLAMPMGKLDFLLGYAVAFAVVAAVQS
eukprot:gene48611-59526_t